MLDEEARAAKDMKPSALTVLLVEDDAEIRVLLKEFFELRGDHIVEATNGQEAIEAALQSQPDVILLDLFMPQRDGFSVAQYLREHDELRTIPIIVMTAYGELGMELFNRIDCLGAAPIEYLPKPFNIDHLGELVDRFSHS